MLIDLSASVRIYLRVCFVYVSTLDAQPTEGECEVWNQVNAVLQDSESILSGLQAYKGAGQEIRDVRRPATTFMIMNITMKSQTLNEAPPGPSHAHAHMGLSL